VYERWLLLTLAIGALAFGAVYPWGYWPLAVAAALLGVWALVRSRSGPTPTGLRPLMILLVIVGVAIAVQAAPLPRRALLALTPATDRFLQQYDVGYAISPPPFHSLAIDASSTLTVLALYSSLALLLAGLARAGARVDLERVVVGLTFFGIVMAVFGIVQRAALGPSEAHRVYGVWESTYKGDPFGPFINRNHFAGWMILTVALVMGHSLAVFERARRPRAAGAGDWLRWLATPAASQFAFVILAVLVMATALVLTRSRSGIGGLVIAGVVMTFAMARRTGSPVQRGLVATYGVALVGGAIFWGGLSSTLARFATASVDMASRWSAWQDTWRIIGDLPWFGTGLGNYAAAMLIYQSANRDTMFAQAHNDYLQILAEGGVLVALPVVMTLVMIVHLIRRRFADGREDRAAYWRRAGAVAGLCGIAAQSLVEFSLQMPANAALFVVTLAIALQPSARVPTRAHRI
jgi:putative inorganic carbon (hco3(-)) transporter